MLLTEAEIAALTGYQRTGAQVRWLRRYGIEPLIAADGRPRVTWDAVQEAQRRLSGMEAQRVQRRGPRPNLRSVT